MGLERQLEVANVGGAVVTMLVPSPAAAEEEADFVFEESQVVSEGRPTMLAAVELLGWMTIPADFLDAGPAMMASNDPSAEVAPKLVRHRHQHARSSSSTS